MSIEPPPVQGKLIHHLSPELSNKIAAGEVVQRPGSVVKELLDNAIDSGADAIELIIVNSGKTLIQVSDNGSGIHKEDIILSFLRHATSKIKTIDDLFNIRSMGFRGEALASIASVAQVTMRSRSAESEHGYEYEIWDGEQKHFQPVPMEIGTTVTVKNLFYNVPARRSFLKTDATEFRHILITFQQLALANPEIAFTVIADSDVVYKLPQQALDERITAIFGNHYKMNLINFGEITPYVKVSGYLIDPKMAKKTRGEQFLFVNSRPFSHRALHYVILNVYRQWIRPNEYPFYALYFEINSRDVDVNVHPTKLEVKFEDERGITSIAQTIVKKALYEYVSLPMQKRDRAVSNSINDDYDFSYLRQNIVEKESDSESSFHFPSRINRQSASLAGKKSIDEFYKQMEGSVNIPTGFNTESEKMSKKPDYNRDRGFWQLHDTYILSQTRTGLCIVDQHLAHKRILFEKSLESAENTLPSTQQLLFPETIEFSATDFQLLKTLHYDFQRMGFNIQLLSGATAMITGVPSDLRIGDERNVMESILSGYQELNKSDFTQREKLAMAVARQAAIPRGKKLSQLEMEKLIDELFACDDPFREPSGKPTLNYIPMDELQLRFR